MIRIKSARGGLPSMARMKPFAWPLAVVLAVACAAPSFAQHRDEPRGARDRRAPPPPTMRGPLHLDQRYHHDHFYPGPGLRVDRLPERGVRVPHGGRDWYFQGGVWWRPAGGGFVVATPPLGIVVPILPPAYVSLWIAGTPYYYANGVYYTPTPNGFVVVAPPPGATVAEAVPPSYAYPRNGQTGQQAENDRAACDQWAAVQPGTRNDLAAAQRAFAACMEGRGYTVR